ncbi:MAG: hypothetical protein P8Y36_01095 [Alphaproteobacteria bacterium]
MPLQLIALIVLAAGAVIWLGLWLSRRPRTPQGSKADSAGDTLSGVSIATPEVPPSALQDEDNAEDGADFEQHITESGEPLKPRHRRRALRVLSLIAHAQPQYWRSRRRRRSVEALWLASLAH